jgi:hypothetical protein
MRTVSSKAGASIISRMRRQRRSLYLRKRPFAALQRNDAMGQFQTFALAAILERKSKAPVDDWGEVAAYARSGVDRGKYR